MGIEEVARKERGQLIMHGQASNHRPRVHLPAVIKNYPRVDLTLAVNCAGSSVLILKKIK